jgi:hypothetical protein
MKLSVVVCTDTDKYFKVWVCENMSARWIKESCLYDFITSELKREKKRSVDTSERALNALLHKKNIMSLNFFQSMKIVLRFDNLSQE